MENNDEDNINEENINEENDRVINIKIMGTNNVGKSSILRYIFGFSFEDEFKSNVLVRKLFTKLDNTNIILNFLPTDNIDGILMIFDITDPTSFNFNEYFDNPISTSIPCIIAGNKSDLRKNRKTDPKKIYEYIKMYNNDHNVEYYEVSAKTGHNINAMFNGLIKQIIYGKFKQSEKNDNL